MNKKSELQRKLIDMCAQWVARDCRPLSAVEDAGFRNILYEFAPRLHEVARVSVLTRLREVEKSIEKEIINNLEKIPAVAGTTDLWTDAQRSAYCSITMHYVELEIQVVFNCLLKNRGKAYRRGAVEDSGRYR